MAPNQGGDAQTRVRAENFGPQTSPNQAQEQQTYRCPMVCACGTQPIGSFHAAIISDGKTRSSLSVELPIGPVSSETRTTHSMRYLKTSCGAGTWIQTRLVPTLTRNFLPDPGPFQIAAVPVPARANRAAETGSRMHVWWQKQVTGPDWKVRRGWRAKVRSGRRFPNGTHCCSASI